MTALAVDAEAMRRAIPQVEQLVSLLNDTARELGGITVPAGVPAGLGARVVGTVEAAGRELRAQARELAGVPGDLRRRVAAAQLADAPQLAAAGWGLRLLGLHFSAFTIQNLTNSMSWGIAARELRDGLAGGESYQAGNWRAFRLSAAAAKEAAVTRGVPSALATTVKLGGRGVTGAGWALTAYSNFRDPRLSTEQKVGRTAASIATGTGVSVLAGGATAAAFGSAAGPLGTVVGFGAGTAWTLLDNKFGVSRKIGDTAADAAGEVEDAAGAVGHGAGSVAHKALGVVGL